MLPDPPDGLSRGGLSRTVWRVSLPLVFAVAIETLDHLIDTLFLSRVGVTELGAIGLADAVFLFFVIPPVSLSVGIQVQTARHLGRGRPEAAGRAFDQGLLLVLAASLVCAAALELLASPLAAALASSPGVGRAVGGYLRIDALSIPFAGAAFAGGALLTSLEDTWALLPTTAILVACYAGLNWLLVFGRLGFPALGIRGAAVGSVGGELAAAGFLAFFIARRYGGERYGFFSFEGGRRSARRALVRLCAPVAAQDMLENLGWLAFFLVVERAGEESLAVANVVYTCYAALSVPAQGFAETATSMVSGCIGGRRPERIGAVLRSTTGGALLATAPLAAAALLAPEALMALLSPPDGLLAAGREGLRVAALSMLAVVPADQWFAAVIGTGDTVASLAIEGVHTAVLVGAAYVGAAVLGWPVAGVWLAVPLSRLAGLAASYAWLRTGGWRRGG